MITISDGAKIVTAKSEKSSGNKAKAPTSVSDSLTSRSNMPSPVKKRPYILEGKTYGIKSPLTDHTLFLTINDICDENGVKRPFEIFINSKDMSNYQWIVALTRMLSALLRRGGDNSFIFEELSCIADPGERGGYLSPKGKYIPSLVAEISGVIKEHFVSLGIMTDAEMTSEIKDYLLEKRNSYIENTGDTLTNTGYPSTATVCPSCSYKAVVCSEGCNLCLQCGSSKCG